MWRAVVNHGFINWVCGLIRENTSGKARYALFHSKVVTTLEDIVVHLHIFTEELEFVFHVLEEASDHSSKMNYVSWLVLFKNLACIFQFSIINKSNISGCNLRSPS